MSNIIPFSFEDKQVRVQLDEQGQPWFCAADVCEVLEHTNPRKAIADHVDEEDVTKRYTLTAGGRQAQNHINESGLYALIFGSTKEEAKRFKKWVTSEVLPSIRKTGAYVPKAPSAKPTEDFKDYFRVARLIGLDKNASAIAANNAVVKLTGTDILALMGATHLPAENQQGHFFTPTELGKELGISAKAFNLLLADAGLQARIGDHWEPSMTAEGLYRLFDTGKKHKTGVPVTQVKWSRVVLGKVRPEVLS